MLSRDFEIYYYNEPASEKVSIHSHDYYEFYFFLEGDVSDWMLEESVPDGFRISSVYENFRHEEHGKLPYSFSGIRIVCRRGKRDAPFPRGINAFGQEFET